MLTAIYTFWVLVFFHLHKKIALDLSIACMIFNFDNNLVIMIVLDAFQAKFEAQTYNSFKKN